MIAQPNEDEVIYTLLPIGEDRRRNETKTKKKTGFLSFSTAFGGLLLQGLVPRSMDMTRRKTKGRRVERGKLDSLEGLKGKRSLQSPSEGRQAKVRSRWGCLFESLAGFMTELECLLFIRSRSARGVVAGLMMSANLCSKKRFL